MVLLDKRDRVCSCSACCRLPLECLGQMWCLDPSSNGRNSMWQCSLCASASGCCDEDAAALGRREGGDKAACCHSNAGPFAASMQSVSSCSARRCGARLASDRVCVPELQLQGAHHGPSQAARSADRGALSAAGQAGAAAGGPQRHCQGLRHRAQQSIAWRGPRWNFVHFCHLFPCELLCES